MVSQSTPLLLLPHAAVIVSGVSSRTGSGSTRTTLLGLACLKALATYKPPAILPFIDTLMGLTNSGHKQELFQALTPIASSINSPDTVSLVDFDTSSSSNTINGVDHSHLAGPEGVITHFSHNNSNNNNSNKINSNNNNLAELHYSVSSLLHISGSSGLSSSTSSSAPLVVLANLVCFLAKSNTLLFEKVLSWLNDILKPQLQHLVLAPSVDSISVTSLNSIVALLTELKEFGSENIELFSRYKDLLESFANINIPAIREVAVQGLDIIDEFLLRYIHIYIYIIHQLIDMIGFILFCEI